MGRMTSETSSPAAPEASPDRKVEQVEHRQRPRSEAFKRFIASGWGPRRDTHPALSDAAGWAAARRDALSAQFPGERLVVPAGTLRVRSNDTDYRFRPHSAFSHLTGLGTDQEPDAVLVLEPRTGAEGAPGGHDAALYFRPRAERNAEEFYADARYGELWVGVRPSLAEIAALTGLDVRHLDELADAIRKDVGEGGIAVRVVRAADASVDEALDAARGSLTKDAEDERQADAELARAVSELRLVKDAYEIAQMHLAVAVDRPRLRGHRARACRARGLARRARRRGGVRPAGTARGQRRRLRHDRRRRRRTPARCTGSATTARSFGRPRPIDAGVEVDSLYTADVTRTLPGQGRFTQAQRRVYEAVLEAADAAFEAARPGRTFREVHEAAMQVIATRLRVGPDPGVGRGDAGRGRPVPPPVDGPRDEPSPRHRRPRLRAGEARDVPRRRSWSRAWCSRSSPACTSRPTTCGAPGVPRHRRPDRGRHAGHRGRPENLSAMLPRTPGRGRGLDGPPTRLTVSPDLLPPDLLAHPFGDADGSPRARRRLTRTP